MINITLNGYVTQTLNDYFSVLGGETPTNPYETLIAQTEKPLIEFVMAQTEGNQSKAAEMLGINRNTLRKKIKLYKLDD